MAGKVYLAGPVVATNEVKAEIATVYGALVRHFGADNVYRPGMHKVPNEWGITMEMWGQCVFTMDVMAIDAADWIVLCNYGRTGATAGTAWECGYAFAKGKKILVVNMPGVRESSLMVRGCAANVTNFDTFEEGSGVDLNRVFVERARMPSTETLN
jgi:nucleoside deoxyribosyltransferase